VVVVIAVAAAINSKSWIEGFIRRLLFFSIVKLLLTLSAALD
jgi:hypothetical protein